MRFRRAEPRDLDAVGEITVAAYAGLHEATETDYVERLRNAEARYREAELWVAVEDDDVEVLGSVTICRDGSPWREIARADEGEFRMLAVAPRAQGRGVGAELVRLCVDRFRESGAPGIVLSTLAQMTSAHRLYDRFGFVRDPSRDWSPAPGVDLLAYHLDLTE